MTVRRLLRAFPATVTRAARARALKTVIGMAVSVGMRTGKTVAARTWYCVMRLKQQAMETTYIHDFSQRLQSGARTLSWLTQRFEKRRDGLIDRLRTHLLLKDIKRLGGCRPDVCFVVDERHADHRDDLVLVAFALSLGGVEPVENETANIISSTAHTSSRRAPS